MDTAQSPRMPDWGMDAPEYFDEDAMYKEDNPEDPTHRGTQKVVLRPLGDVNREGAVKTMFEGNPYESYGLTNDTSDYLLTVDRLVWIDGWRKTWGVGADKTHQDAMSLVVFNIKFFNKRQDSKSGIGGAVAELRFLSDLKRGEHPEVVAWGPFRHQETWNFSAASLKITTKADLKASAGGAGQEVSASLGREKELSRDIVAFNEGCSTHLYPQGSRARQGQNRKPNGVQWMLRQNHLHEQGVESEMRIAALIFRPEQIQPYHVSLRLRAYTGVKEAVRNAAQRLSGRPIGDQIHWRAETNLDKMRRCFGEGASIAKSIDSENLGDLIRDPSDGQNLDQQWLKPRNHLELSKACQDGAGIEPEGSSGTYDVASDTAEIRMNFQPSTFAGGQSSKPNEGTAPAYPAKVMQATAGVPEFTTARQGSPTSGNKRHGKQDAADFISESYKLGFDAVQDRPSDREHHRLVSLEIRAAQAEARLAVQDQLILKLQRTVDMLEQTISAAAYPA